MNTATVSSANVAGYVGIDVAKDKLDLAHAGVANVQSFPNDPAGIDQIVQLLLPLRPAVIVIESTGGLERPLLQALLDADLPAALVHPGRVRYFAKSLGVLAKTDRLDAHILARFGQLAEPRLSAKRSQNQLELQALVTCRRQLSTTRVQQTNRLGAVASKSVQRTRQTVIDTLARQIDKLDRQIRDLIDADDDFKHLDTLLQSVPGVGPTLAATLVADTPELGQTDRQKICAVVGVAPYNADSGNHTGQRSIRGGRTAVRSVLYMATLAALRCNPLIKAFAERLKAKGKMNKVIIVAAMRKLLCLLNAMIRDRLPWHELTVVKKLAINT